MKYALLFFALSFQSLVFANTVHSFDDSNSLLAISQFLLDNAEDMHPSILISDKKLVLRDFSTCAPSSIANVLKEFQSAVKNVYKLYPDEELPVEEALLDLESYIGDHTLQKCELYKKTDHTFIRTIYYFDELDLRHIKLDTITHSN